jgi:hypothetical protein
MRNAYRFLIGKPERIRPLGRANREWKYKLKWVLVKKKFEEADWIHMALDRDMCGLLFTKCICGFSMIRQS